MENVKQKLICSLECCIFQYKVKYNQNTTELSQTIRVTSALHTMPGDNWDERNNNCSECKAQPNWYINSLRPRRKRRHYADAIFKCIFLNEKEWISLRISLKFVPKDRINNIPSLVQIMAWRRPGDKPLSEPMMVKLPTHICVTRPQWVNSLWPSAATWWHRYVSTLAQVRACCLTAPNHYLNKCWFIMRAISQEVQHGCHFVHSIFKWIFFSEEARISMEI